MRITVLTMSDKGPNLTDTLCDPGHNNGSAPRPVRTPCLREFLLKFGLGLPAIGDFRRVDCKGKKKL